VPRAGEVRAEPVITPTPPEIGDADRLLLS
jgi:hypothetical protein